MGGHWGEGSPPPLFGQDTTSSNLAGQSLPHFYYLSLASLLPNTSHTQPPELGIPALTPSLTPGLPPLPLPGPGRCLIEDPRNLLGE